MTTKFQIYTVPGQVYYNSTRKLVLQGADGIVFVADSRRGKMDENLESYGNLEENLREYGMDITTTPMVMQYNKRDLPEVYSIEDLEEKLNKHRAPYFEAVAVTGEGVFPTLKKLSQMVLESLNRQQGSMATRSPRKLQDARENPVTAGAQSKVKAMTPVPVAAGVAASSGGGLGPSRKPSTRAAAGPVSSKPGKAGVRVVREPVSNSPGIRPIERKSPGAEPVVRKRPTTSRVPALPQGAPTPKGHGGLIAAFALAAAGVVGAILYFSGALNSFFHG